jgi:hypothetical protein
MNVHLSLLICCQFFENRTNLSGSGRMCQDRDATLNLDVTTGSHASLCCPVEAEVLRVTKKQANGKQILFQVTIEKTPIVLTFHWKVPTLRTNSLPLPQLS